MREKTGNCSWYRNRGMTIATVLAVTVLAVGAGPAAADEAADTRQIVERAHLTLESFVADPNMGAFRSLVKDAKAVLIAPQVLKLAFIFGASGGSGVLLVRDDRTGGWNGPAFYTMGQVSFGLQAGGEASEVVLLAMTERGVSALQASSVKLGANADIAAGPVGFGAAAATANLSADLISFARSKGLYAGLSVDGAVVATRDGWNRAYYGREVTPSDILIRRTVSGPQAAGLIKTLGGVAGGK